VINKYLEVIEKTDKKLTELEYEEDNKTQIILEIIRKMG